MTTNTITPPADARQIFDWESDGLGWARWFDGTERAAGPATVTITGRQFDDGAALRGVSVALGSDELLDADEAHALAAALVEAADELTFSCGHEKGERLR